jgi:ABC-2 type transport system permease protein
MTRPTLRAGLLLPAVSLWRRELTRFFRQRSRVVGAILQPLFFWLLFGTAFHASFSVPSQASGGLSYLEFFFPGTVVLIVLFTSIFATISVIEDRNEGFLQSVLVAPVPRAAIVTGKIAGGATLGFIQGMIFLLLAPLLGIEPSVTTILATAGVLALIAVALTGLGFLLAWRMDSTQGFHAVMSALLLPMWLLSGSFFPIDGAPAVLRWITMANPLTYGVAALRHVLYLGDGVGSGVAMPSLPVCLAVTAGFGIGSIALATFGARKGGRV